MLTSSPRQSIAGALFLSLFATLPLSATPLHEGCDLRQSLQVIESSRPLQPEHWQVSRNGDDLWLVDGQTLLRATADGQIRGRVHLSFEVRDSYSTADDGLIVLPESRHGRVWRLDANGRLLWRGESANQIIGEFSDGRIAVITPAHTVRIWAPNGAVLREISAEAFQLEDFYRGNIGPADELVLASLDPNRPNLPSTLLWLDGDGREKRQIPLDIASGPRPTLLADGRLWVVENRDGAGRQSLYDANGELLRQQDFSLDPYPVFRRLSATRWLLADEQRLQILDANGNQQEIPFRAEGIYESPPALVPFADGVAALRAAGDRRVLTAISASGLMRDLAEADPVPQRLGTTPNGGLLWVLEHADGVVQTRRFLASGLPGDPGLPPLQASRTVLPAAAVDGSDLRWLGGDDSRRLLGQSLVCHLRGDEGEQRYDCVDRSTAAPRHQTQLQRRHSATLLADDRLRIVALRGTGAYRLDILPDGSREEQELSGITQALDFRVDRSGRVVVLDRRPDNASGTGQLLIYAADQATPAVFTTPLSTLEFSRMLAPGSGEPLLLNLRVNGQERLLQVSDQGGLIAQAPLTSTARLIEAYRLSDGTQLVQLQYLTDMRQSLLHVDGDRVIWQQERPVFRLKTHLYGAQAILVSSDPNGVLLERLSAATGESLELGRFANGGRLDQLDPFSPVPAHQLDANGKFRILIDMADSAYGIRTEYCAKQLDPVAPTRIPVDQSGLSGVWYAPNNSGQGFFLDYFPQSRTLFMPWFTYNTGPESANTTSSPLRTQWYTLQGSVTADSPRAELTLFQNTVGNFMAGPATIAEPIGQAVLTAVDCNRAVLGYRFGSTGPESTIVLHRLAGGGAPCRLPDGRQQPGRDQRPPARGFDTRMSGAWRVPDLSGQGFMLSVDPPQGAQPGLLFGAWFTYRDASVRDDDQHAWFSIQAALNADGPNGRAQGVLYVAHGGFRDAGINDQVDRVGEFTIQFHDCQTATAHYRFDRHANAGPLAGQQGQIELQRLAPCAAP
ncbi:MAG: hypothetical protein MUE46_19030 [Xanthomonadales bacterium]|nr:hypothetical protein [Xanthomonadales bacterium]